MNTKNLDNEKFSASENADLSNRKDITDQAAGKKQKRQKKHTSAGVAASAGRSAVDQVKASSRRDVDGTSGLTNTGPFVSYEKED